MGAYGEFEFRRAELAHLQGCDLFDIEDDEVIQSYEESVAPGGLMRKYLELAQVGLQHDTDLYTFMWIMMHLYRFIWT